MSIIHKKNSGYIGVDYREPYPSGIRVSGGVGRVREVTVDVELYGGKGGQFVANIADGVPGNGGYTKFRFTADTTKLIQIRPSYMSGGSRNNWGGEGGNGAGLLVSNEWLGVAGGGGGCGGRYEVTFGGSFTRYPTNGGNGSGGYGSNAPSSGGGGTACGPYTDTGTSPYNYAGASGTGSSGGGASGGASTAGSCNGSWFNPGPTTAGYGGGGNLRIYYDQSATSGNLNAVPGVYMQYITHSNGSHNGSAQVKLTNVDTTQNYTYTSSKDLKAIYLATGEFNP